MPIGHSVSVLLLSKSLIPLQKRLQGLLNVGQKRTNFDIKTFRNSFEFNLIYKETLCW